MDDVKSSRPARRSLNGRISELRRPRARRHRPWATRLSAAEKLQAYKAVSQKSAGKVPGAAKTQRDKAPRPRLISFSFQHRQFFMSATQRSRPLAELDRDSRRRFSNSRCCVFHAAASTPNRETGSPDKFRAIDFDEWARGSFKDEQKNGLVRHGSRATCRWPCRRRQRCVVTRPGARHGARKLCGGRDRGYSRRRRTRHPARAFDCPKGMFPVGPTASGRCSKSSPIRLLATGRRLRCDDSLVFWMTSEATDAETRAVISDPTITSDWPPDQVIIFKQGTTPAVAGFTNRQTVLARSIALAISPDGHGGTLRHSIATECLERMKGRRAHPHLFYFQVDNPLVHVVRSPNSSEHHLLFHAAK